MATPPAEYTAQAATVQPAAVLMPIPPGLSTVQPVTVLPDPTWIATVILFLTAQLRTILPVPTPMPAKTTLALGHLSRVHSATRQLSPAFNAPEPQRNKWRRS